MSDRWREFLDAVSEMRHRQREYFRTRSTTALEQSKRAEKQVDEMCAAMRCGQRTLFDNGGK
jgi:hypothetical protein